MIRKINQWESRMKHEHPGGYKVVETAVLLFCAFIVWCWFIFVWASTGGAS